MGGGGVSGVGGWRERIFVLMKNTFKIQTLISKTLSLERSYPRGN